MCAVYHIRILRNRVNFPAVLDMSKYVETKDKPLLYELAGETLTYLLDSQVGVLIHKGISAYGGHYIANIRDEE